MPRLWTETIDEHRRAVREAVLAAVAALVRESGLRGLTMAAVAGRTGIARATLYRYFPDLETLLLAWHERVVADHLQDLEVVARGPGGPGARLSAVLFTYAASRSAQPAGAPAVHLHGGSHVAGAQRDLALFLEALIGECQAAGVIRGDLPSSELATFCTHALAGAAELATPAAVERLVELTLSGMRT